MTDVEKLDEAVKYCHEKKSEQHEEKLEELRQTRTVEEFVKVAKEIRDA